MPIPGAVETANKEIIASIIVFLRTAVETLLYDNKAIATRKFEKLLIDSVSIRTHFKMKIEPFSYEDLDIYRQTVNGIVNLCLRTFFLYINNLLEGNLTILILNNIKTNVAEIVDAVRVFEESNFTINIGEELKRCIKLLLGLINQHCVCPTDMGSLYSYQDALAEVGRLNDSFTALIREIDTSLEYFMAHMTDFNEVDIKAQHAEVILIYLRVVVRILEGGKHRIRNSRTSITPLIRQLQKLFKRTKNSFVHYAITQCLNSLDSIQSEVKLVWKDCWGDAMGNNADTKRYERTVVLKPSTEFLPDEYPLSSPSEFLVNIFHGHSFSDEATQLAEVFETNCKFTVSKQKFVKNTEMIAKLTEVANSVDIDTLGVFIIILCKKTGPGCVAGDEERVGVKFADVWQPFLAKTELNRKPKMFMFQVCDVSVRNLDLTDNRRIYDTAAPDADFLLISRNITARDDFIRNFCQHIGKRGKYVDILEAAMFGISYNPPLIVSTLTARFFPVESEFRGYTYLNIQDITRIKGLFAKK